MFLARLNMWIYLMSNKTDKKKVNGEMQDHAALGFLYFAYKHRRRAFAMIFKPVSLLFPA